MSLFNIGLINSSVNNQTLTNEPLIESPILQKKTQWYESSLIQLPGALLNLVTRTVILARSILYEVAKRYKEVPTLASLVSKLPNKFGEIFDVLKKFAVVGIVTLPINFFILIDKITDVVNAIFSTANKNRDILIIANAMMAAIAALGRVFDFPATVINTIRLFMPVKDMAWVPPLAIVSAILSVGNFFCSALNCLEASRFAYELKIASNRAFLQRLRDLSQSESLFRSLNILDSSLADKIDEELKRLENGDSQSFNQIMEEIENANLDPHLMNELYKAANLAYADVIKSKDKKFLEKHFDVKTELIQSALNNINNQSSEELNDLRETLEGRLTTSSFSNKISVVIEAVNLAATILLVISAFVLTASPLMPIAYGLLIGVGLVCIIRAIDKYEKVQIFEHKLLSFVDD